MRAQVGDRIVVRSQHLGHESRHGVILEVHGDDGKPPYLVGWTDGHEALYFPANDAHIEPKRLAEPARP